jgi:hypothetical protein
MIYLAIAGVVEARVGGENEKTPGVGPPPDLVRANNRLHDGVEPTFRRVQVARHLGIAHFRLFGPRESQKKRERQFFN